MLTAALLIVLAPLVGFVLQLAFGRRLPRQGDLLTVAAIGVALAASVWIAIRMLGGEGAFEQHWTWMVPGAASDPWTVGFHIDGLTAVMLVVVTLVSFLVHVFSMGYMHGDPKYWLFFAWLQMFSVSMLILVLAGNLLHLFIGWELVGLCSYKLIGFWSEKKAPCDAARKAFITTRIGDLGMMVALFAIYQGVGSFEFGRIFDAVAGGAIAEPWLTITGIGLFAAAAGKSAQMPLHVWLPDAMEGPTPVSALIHAATMVAAGVYLVGRMMPVFTPEALTVVAVTGAVTALMAGLIALAQNDIKKVLAYSTVSQLGYMFIGLGVGAWHAALFHLTTHAFFKALMFLGSGSVIHACHHEQDMRKMGGLWKKLPVTGTTFAIGVLAIAGFPFVTSGFFSKDAILAGAFHRFPALYWMALFGAFLTAFYMMRLFVMTFLGAPKDEHIHEHAHEGGRSMTLPLVVLGVLAVCAGWGAWHTTLLPEPKGGLIESLRTVGSIAHFEHSNAVMAMAIAAGLGGLAAGLFVFLRPADVLARWKRPFAWLENAFQHKFWFDEVYRDVVLRPAYALARFFGAADANAVDGLVNAVGRGGLRSARVSGATDRVVVDGAVLGTGWTLWGLGGLATWTQNGRVRAYLSWSVVAVAVLFIFTLVF